MLKQTERAAASTAAAAPFAPTQPMKAAACAAHAALRARLLRSGSVAAGQGLGLAYPAVAVAPNGAAVIAFTYAGPGRTADGMADANAGVGAAYLDSNATGTLPMATLQRAPAPLAPTEVPAPAAGKAAAAAAGAAAAEEWGELSAADVHPVTGAVYVAARKGGPTRTGRGHVATWVGVMPMATALAPPAAAS